MALTLRLENRQEKLKKMSKTDTGQINSLELGAREVAKEFSIKIRSKHNHATTYV